MKSIQLTIRDYLDKPVAIDAELIPRTDKMFAVHQPFERLADGRVLKRRGWRITHTPTGIALGSVVWDAKHKAIAAGQRAYSICRRRRMIESTDPDIAVKAFSARMRAILKGKV